VVAEATRYPDAHWNRHRQGPPAGSSPSASPAAPSLSPAPSTKRRLNAARQLLRSNASNPETAMARVGFVPLEADRWVPFVRTFDFYDQNLTNADMRAQVRLYADQPGNPIWDLPKVIDGNLMGLQFLGLSTISGRTVSSVRMHIPEVEMRAHAPFPGERGDDVLLAWDLILTINELRRRVLAGPFTIKAGVTQ
jgi:hypothetical protein